MMVEADEQCSFRHSSSRNRPLKDLMYAFWFGTSLGSIRRRRCRDDAPSQHGPASELLP